jgi:hypothetical protein
MKRWLSFLSGLLFLTTAVPATADPGHERPKITTFRFAQPPLKAGIDEVLIVTAHDPDSWIYEVQARWEDENQNGGALFADTFCLQDPDYSDPGTPARLKLPVQFDHPGRYHVEVRALSAYKCRGGSSEKSSRTVEMDVMVSDPLKTATDPDDSLGVLDISSIEQTQEPSETSVTTEIVHRVKMFDSWDNEALAGDSYMEMWFDLDSDPSTFERVLTIDLDEQDGTLRASMLDSNSGQGRGYAAATRPDGNTLEVRMPPLLLKKGLRSYRWYVSVNDSAQAPCLPEDPCSDIAPDSALMRHRL